LGTDRVGDAIGEPAGPDQHMNTSPPNRPEAYRRIHAGPEPANPAADPDAPRSQRRVAGLTVSDARISTIDFIFDPDKLRAQTGVGQGKRCR